ncbi:MAG: methyltransferase domain-containing protein [Nitrospiraceae bacterium]|nr:methyltransferase domain-containing protein [Nitrospiraceae bacterium]
MAEYVCPVWVGHLLASPVRKLFQEPRKILSPYVKPGMTVLDVGCAMGFFSLPLARLVGPDGVAVCVDMQEKMFQRLETRARKAGVIGQIQTRTCSQDTLGLGDLAEAVDFALLFAMVHEVPDAARLFSELHRAMKPAGQVLMAEPKGHVRAKAFDTSLASAEQCGFVAIERPRIRGSHAVVLSKV